MKLTKQGAYKYEGITTLVDVELPTEHGFLIWNPALWNVALRVRGREGPSTYHYDLQFSADELAMLVETALTQASEDALTHFNAKTLGAFIRAVLTEKNKPDDNDA